MKNFDGFQRLICTSLLLELRRVDSRLFCMFVYEYMRIKWLCWSARTHVLYGYARKSTFTYYVAIFMHEYMCIKWLCRCAQTHVPYGYARKSTYTLYVIIFVRTDMCIKWLCP